MRTRRRMRRTTAVGAACVILGTALAGCGDDGDRLEATVEAQRAAGTWKTWVLGSPTDVIVPPPPAKGSDKAEADLNAVKDMVDQRTP